MKPDPNNTMLYGATLIALLGVILFALQMRSCFTGPKTAEEIEASVRKKNPNPDLLDAQRDFSDADRNMPLEYEVEVALAKRHASAGICMDYWPNPPQSAKARLSTDSGGRIITFAFENANADVETCFGQALRLERLPPVSKGVIRIDLPRPASIP